MHAGLLHKLNSYGIPGQVFGHFSSFLSNRWLWVVLDGKSSQEYPVILEYLKGPFLLLHFSYYTLMTFLMMLSVILLSTDQASDLWQQLELASEFESDLQDVVVWGRKWLVDFNAEKTQLVLFHQSKSTGAIDKNGWVCSWGKNHLSRCWAWLSLLNWIGALTLSLLLKLPLKKWSLDLLFEVSFSWDCFVSL